MHYALELGTILRLNYDMRRKKKENLEVGSENLTVQATQWFRQLKDMPTYHVSFDRIRYLLQVVLVSSTFGSPLPFKIKM